MATELEKFFSDMWTMWLDASIDAGDVQQAMLDAKLAEWVEATEDDMTGHYMEDVEVGDQILKPTDAGWAALVATAIKLVPECESK